MSKELILMVVVNNMDVEVDYQDSLEIPIEALHHLLFVERVDQENVVAAYSRNFARIMTVFRRGGAEDSQHAF